jgi:hypothetical protein
VIVKGFNSYRQNNILSNEAVFEIYIDKSQIKEIFSINQEQLNDIKNYSITCKIPVKANGTFSQYVGVSENLNINCDNRYESGKYIRYASYQLENSNHFELLLINNSNSYFDERFDQNKIISKVPFDFNYRKGEINRIFITKDEIYNYCSKK